MTSRMADVAWATGPRRPRLAGWPGALVHLVVFAATLAGWLVSLARTDVARVGEYGLLATIFPAFFAAVLLVVTGFVVELTWGPGRGPILTGYLIAAILLIHATTPLLLAQPQYAWTFKHVGVAEFFATHGQVSDTNDIYQQWPALFTVVAQISAVSGVSALSLAKWAPVGFNLGGALVLFALARTLTPHRRVAYLTVFTFECLNWVEQDYLSPQGFAFLLSLGALLITLRWLRPGVSRRVRLLALPALIAVLAVITASHQLTPYLVALDLIMLVLVNRLRPRWAALVALAVPVLYLIPRLHLVTGSFNIFESPDFFQNASGTAQDWGTAGQAFSAVVVRALSALVWLTTAVAVWRQRRHLDRISVPALLALAPFGLLLAQSYGGEAIYRVFLFSAPWCAYLIADLVLGAGAARGEGVARREGVARGADRTQPSAPPASKRRSGGPAPCGSAPGRLVKTGAGVLLLAVTLLATMQGRDGQLMVDRQTTDEVDAARYLYAHAAPGSTIVLGTPNFPSRVAANYGEFNRSVAVGEPDLVQGAHLQHVSLNPAYLPAIENYARGFDGTETYLVLSTGMKRYAHYFGYLPDGSFDLLDESLASSDRWSLWYRNPDVVIYRLLR